METELASAVVENLKSKFGSLILGPFEFRGEISIEVTDNSRILEVCSYAKNEAGLDLLKDITSVDFLGETPRFMLVYELYSLSKHFHLRIKTRVPENPANCPSVSHIWRAAEWHEREIYDLMGIVFTNHPDLRRILMWEGYPYHPLRKDFPLAGIACETPGVAFADSAPLEGGPFLSQPGAADASEREPRARPDQGCVQFKRDGTL